MKTDYIPQAQLPCLERLVAPGKVVVIYGPRRVGKTTLLRHYANRADEDALIVTGEDISVREYLLLYGSYPEVVLLDSNAERERYLKELVSAYLYKDILQIEDVRHADKLNRLLQLLAFQIGREVSVSELGTQLGMSKNTVDRYLDLLEKVFVIYARRGFSRNPRKEISKSRRYYFYDNGIRNTLINNFNPLSLRDDTGALWENYAVTERLKANLYLDRQVESAFWRTYTQQEIDLVEQRGDRLAGFELKWRPPRSTAAPSGWTRDYPNASFTVVHKDNYMPFVSGSEPGE